MGAELKPLPEGYFMRIRLVEGYYVYAEIRKRNKFWKFSEVVVSFKEILPIVKEDPENEVGLLVEGVHKEFWLYYEGNTTKQKAERYLDTVVGDYPPKEWKK